MGVEGVVLVGAWTGGIVLSRERKEAVAQCFDRWGTRQRQAILVRTLESNQCERANAERTRTQRQHDRIVKRGIEGESMLGGTRWRGFRRVQVPMPSVERKASDCRLKPSLPWGTKSRDAIL
jgi:hypothetical protein